MFCDRLVTPLQRLVFNVSNLYLRFVAILIGLLLSACSQNAMQLQQPNSSANKWHCTGTESRTWVCQEDELPEVENPYDTATAKPAVPTQHRIAQQTAPLPAQEEAQPTQIEADSQSVEQNKTPINPDDDFVVQLAAFTEKESLTRLSQRESLKQYDLKGVAIISNDQVWYVMIAGRGTAAASKQLAAQIKMANPDLDPWVRTTATLMKAAKRPPTSN